MPLIDILSKLHRGTKRDYLQRVTSHDKALCAEVAVQFGEEYWDGARHHGYGGYRYDGRWRPAAEEIASHYGLKKGDKVLDVGCGKGFLLYELTQAVPGIQVAGIDISEYAVTHAKEEVRSFLRVGNAVSLPYDRDSFDFVVSITTLHNLYLHDLQNALQEIERVAKGNKKYVVVESYRTEVEKVNLMYWQLTCRQFHTPNEWEWLYQQSGYTGDYGFIFFE
jgi:protein-L-isoaspartate(D-aspartate) O-methyltransferase